jgi:hypothetical protein
VDLEQSPQPWYKSRTVIASAISSALGLAVASGLISPANGSIVSGNIEAIAGGIVAVMGIVSIWSRADVTKVADGKGQGPTTVSVPINSHLGQQALRAEQPSQPLGSEQSSIVRP